MNNFALRSSFYDETVESGVAGEVDMEELYRRLAQTRRLAAGANDPTTRERLTAFISDLEQELAAAEARDADAPGE